MRDQITKLNECDLVRKKQSHHTKFMSQTHEIVNGATEFHRVGGDFEWNIEFIIFFLFCFL